MENLNETPNSGKTSRGESSKTSITENPSAVAQNTFQTVALNILNFSNMLSSSLNLKLDDGNYLLWKSTVLVLLRGQRLDGFVLGTKIKPSEYIPQEEGSTLLTPNPAYDDWLVKDQSLLGWLFSSMELTIASSFLELTSSAEVWRGIEEYFGNVNTSRINQLRFTLQHTKKGTMKMGEYLRHMKQIAANMNIAGEPVSTKSLISNIVAGLEAEYLPITCQINARNNWTWQEFHATMLAFESQLEHLNIIPKFTDSTLPSANLVSSKFQNNGRGRIQGGRDQGYNNYKNSNQGVKGRGRNS